ncbi:hypothetical protein [Parathalassolituus penaei]|uniref:Uncharacterized protein n=1 Tax=Parathalassolituus penaei TaxID=2997323 RepID=A0A9X3ISC2_9GAMM|nr:hypothetical protein [Parathalassolituus penaei]MCY0964734.1 hypothetical protein [Parathalassolituus penaei]
MRFSIVSENKSAWSEQRSGRLDPDIPYCRQPLAMALLAHRGAMGNTLLAWMSARVFMTEHPASFRGELNVTDRADIDSVFGNEAGGDERSGVEAYHWPVQA